MKCGEVRGQGKFKDYQYIRVMQGEDGVLQRDRKMGPSQEVSCMQQKGIQSIPCKATVAIQCCLEKFPSNVSVFSVGKKNECQKNKENTGLKLVKQYFILCFL